METARQYWRQYEASATAWLNKYRYDPFYRTEVNVVILHVAFAIVVLAAAGTVFEMLRHDESAVVIAELGARGTQIANALNAIREQYFQALAVVMFLMTALFGYIIARITLAPARSALDSQKQFIGNIAHEIRTPLSVIKTNTEVALLDDQVVGELKDTMLSNIEELDRVSEIINNLLSLSALVKPERIEFSTVDLSAVATEVVQKFSQLAKRGEHQVTLRKSPDAQVWGNATALQQIVGNLLKNAITYTPRGGHIRLTIEPAPNNYIELIVQDSGMGIARKDLFRIFEPFYRADPSRTKGAGGSGLGLAIVSELVKMHQGRITIRSALGRGTTVSVLFPSITEKTPVGKEADYAHGLNEIAVDFSK